MTSTTTGAELHPSLPTWLIQAAGMLALQGAEMKPASYNLDEHHRPDELDGTPAQAWGEPVDELDVLHEHDPRGHAGVPACDLGPHLCRGDL